MPRIARIVVPGIPYHITQRGNRREPVFFNDSDRQSFLQNLRYYSARHSLEILAYCLMGNHVHLVAVPGTTAALHRTLKPVHLLHAQRINQERDWCGHLWQDRFYSTALDERHFWTAIRYVELNPVRAGMVTRAEHFRWSSAGAHCGAGSDPLLTQKPVWRQLLSGVKDWAAWLDEAIDPATLDALRNNTRKGLPSGSDQFIRAIEEKTGRSIARRSRGRPARGAGRSDSIDG